MRNFPFLKKKKASKKSSSKESPSKEEAREIKRPVRQVTHTRLRNDPRGSSYTTIQFNTQTLF